MTTDRKGAIAETAIIHAAVKLGIGVYKPVVDGGRCDLIFELGDRLVRVQCKWAARRGSVVSVRCHSARRTRGGFVKRSYSADEIDAIVAYCADIDRCFLLPPKVFAGRPYVRLRVSPTRNNQRRRVNWADAYALEGYTERFTGP
jgi:PD-(D/E)XK nuclease superfamily protein